MLVRAATSSGIAEMRRFLQKPPHFGNPARSRRTYEHVYKRWSGLSEILGLGATHCVYAQDQADFTLRRAVRRAAFFVD